MIYKSNLISKEPIQIDVYDVRLASYILNVPVGELQTLLQYTSNISELKAKRLRESKPIILLEKYYQIFEDNSFLINTPRRDWLLLGYIYILNSKADYTAIQNQIVQFASFAGKRLAISKEYAKLQEEVKEKYIQMYRLYTSADTFSFFNYKDFAKVAGSYNIDVVYNEDTVMMQWKDVEIVGVKNEVLYYTRIELVARIPDFYITRFFISIQGFRYDSDWEIDVPIHPNLNRITMLYWGRNNFLEFFPAKNYKAIVETLDDLIRGKNGFYKFGEVYESIKKLSLLWQGIDKGLGYMTRSKALFEMIKPSKPKQEVSND